MVREDLKLAVTRIHKLEGDGATKAFCDMSVMDSLVINGLRVVEGKEELIECKKLADINPTLFKTVLSFFPIPED